LKLESAIPSKDLDSFACHEERTAGLALPGGIMLIFLTIVATPKVR
jgi:hypothetical protein